MSKALLEQNNIEIVLFETEDKEVQLDVAVDGENVWLNRQQMAELFGRDVIKPLGSILIMPRKKNWIIQLSQNLRQFNLKVIEKLKEALNIIV